MKEEIARFIARQEAGGALPPDVGIALSVVKDGSVLCSETYGLRARDQNLPVTPHTIFEIGSLTKAFTSVACMLAAERGQVDFDKPINASRELISLNDNEVTRTMSIGDILSHRTGAAAHDLFWYLALPSREELVRALARLDLVRGGFRQTFVYSNIMYAALGHLFSDLVGDSWEPYVTERILKPLAMTSTSFRPSGEEKDVALPYIGTRRVARRDVSVVAAAGGIRSNLEDLTRWLAMHLNRGRTADGHSLLSEGSIDRVQTTHVAVGSASSLPFPGWGWLGEDVGYGLGWFIGSTSGLNVVCHPGFVDGFSSAIVMVPERRIGCVVLANVNLSDTPALLAKDVVRRLLDAGTAVTRTEDDANPSSKDLAVIGEYTNDIFGTASITFKQGRLVLEYRGNNWPLTWSNESRANFIVGAFGLEIPLSAEFEVTDGTARRLSVPFSLDPRIEPHHFIRTPP